MWMSNQMLATAALTTYPGMSMTKALPGAIGALSIADDRLGGGSASSRIPMYGIQDMNLSKSANWSSNFGPGAVTVHQWNGSIPLSFQFNFTLTAGVHCKSRDILFGWVKAAHAMVTHVLGDDGTPQSPPRCHLIMGKMLNVYGFVTEISCNGLPPWAVTSDNFPTTVVFTGVFMSAPGYDGKLVDVERNTQQDAKSILASGYS